MEVTWAQVVNSMLPLLGVIVGGIATYMTQTHVLKKQFKRELESKKEAENIERLKIYSEVLKLDGEHTMYQYAGNYAKFNLKAFTDEFRPVFFSKFYLLHQELADIIRKMDNVIAEANFNEELERKQNDLLLNYFNQIISTIETKLKEHRNT